MKHLRFHDWPDWKEPEPATHHVYFHDMAMIASHDVPCMVCWDRSAIYERDMTPGQFRATWQPCRECQATGWQMVQRRRRRSPLRVIREWWAARRRRIDEQVLWPTCCKLGGDLDRARGAFSIHAFSDPAWLVLGEDEITRRIHALPWVPPRA